MFDFIVSKIVLPILDRIEDFGYALAGLPPIHRKECSMDHEAEEWRDAVDHDDPEFERDDPEYDDYDMDEYYEGYYGDEDELWGKY